MKSPLLNHRTTIFALLLTVTVMFLSMSPGAGAQNKRLPKRAGHINDFAEVLDAAMKARLETVLENLKEKTGVDFVVVTVKTTGGEDLYEYSLKSAGEWNVGSPSAIDKSVLIVLSADSGKFFSQVTRGARLYLPEGLIGEMGLRMRQKIDTTGFSEGLLTGVHIFVDGTGAMHNFDFASLDPKSTGMLIAEKQRPRTVASPAAEISPSPTPAEIVSATPSPAPSATPSETPSPTPEANATPVSSPSESPAPEATASAKETATPAAQPS